MSHFHVGAISVWGLVGWKSKVTFLRMARPVVEIQEESERLWGLPSKPCLTRLSRLISMVKGFYNLWSFLRVKDLHMSIQVW
eukprot:1017069-Pelagomonas_calceolata.AAC.1